jgi:hypothetical protein
VILTRTDGSREEVDLEAPGRRAEPGETFAWPTPVAVTCAPGVELEGPESEEEESDASDAGDLGDSAVETETVEETER